MLKKLPNDVPFQPNESEWELTFSDEFEFFDRTKWKCNTVLSPDNPEIRGIRRDAFYVPNMYTEFHTYGFLWDADKYTFFVDGHKTWETTHIYKGREMGICRVPEYLLLSTEVAGCMENGVQYPGRVRNPKTGRLENFWCGNPDRNDKTKQYDFIVDYVRCYKRRPHV